MGHYFYHVSNTQVFYFSINIYSISASVNLKRTKRKTMMPDDIYSALKTSGFENFVQQVQNHLHSIHSFVVILVS